MKGKHSKKKKWQHTGMFKAIVFLFSYTLRTYTPSTCSTYFFFIRSDIFFFLSHTQWCAQFLSIHISVRFYTSNRNHYRLSIAEQFSCYFRWTFQIFFFLLWILSYYMLWLLDSFVFFRLGKLCEKIFWLFFFFLAWTPVLF